MTISSSIIFISTVLDMSSVQDVDSGAAVPVGGLAYYISPPNSVTDMGERNNNRYG